ncbi:MAG TPA: helix-turn-helix domain-containing protein, partial [Chloroflexota bacterium]
MNARGQVLRERRLALGLSQESLAEAAGVSARSINRWEQGRATPQPAARRRIAAVLDMPASELAPPGAPTVHETRPSTAADVPAAWHVPPRRNPFFTGREAQLEGVHAALRATGANPRIAALTGLGGIGKTQAALEYAYRYAHAYGAVFWLAADSASACLASFGELATILDLPVRSDPSFARTLAGVRTWFRQNANWLVILDNVEDVRVLDELTLTGDGAVLLTTRAQAVGAVHASFDLQPLSVDDAAVFLLRRGRIIALEHDLREAAEEDRNAARALAARLDGLPLALDQARGYLEETTCGLDVYLQRYETQEHTLLLRRGRLALDHPESVAATLALAFRRISSMNPAAGDLLSLCAFLHADSIPEELLDGFAADPVLLDEAVADLTSLSVVRRDRRFNALTIHRLVQDVVRFALEPDEQRAWAARAVSVVASALPGSELYHFSAFARWIPHALASVELINTWQIRTPEAARLLDLLGAYEQVTGRYAASQQLLLGALRIRKASPP